jgi:hypothetical protein
MRKWMFGLVCVLVIGCTVSERGITFNWGGKSGPVSPVNPVQPITTHEFRCLFIRDNATDSKVTSTQRAMLTGGNTRKFLEENCVKVGDDPGHRYVDKTTELSGIWKDMVAKYPPTGYPWVILTNGADGEGFLLPNDFEPEFTAKMNKYAGVK